MDNRLADFLTTLGDASTVDLAWARTLTFMKSLGISTLHGWFGGATFLSTCPDWWIPHYIAQEYWRHDHVARHCATSAAPIVYGLEVDRGRPDRSDVILRVMDATADEFQLRTGLAIPVPAASPLSGGFNIGTPFGAAEFKKLMGDVGHVAHLAALSAHLRIQELMQGQPSSAEFLTPREREVLLWLAQGRRVAAIADRMTVSEVTVNMHIGNAKRKLGAATREHALAKAVVMGLVKP